MCIEPSILQQPPAPPSGSSFSLHPCTGPAARGASTWEAPKGPGLAVPDVGDTSMWGPPAKPSPATPAGWPPSADVGGEPATPVRPAAHCRGHQATSGQRSCPHSPDSRRGRQMVVEAAGFHGFHVGLSSGSLFLECVDAAPLPHPGPALGDLLHQCHGFSGSRALGIRNPPS